MIDKIKAEIERTSNAINTGAVHYETVGENKALKKFLKWAEELEQQLVNKFRSYNISITHLGEKMELREHEKRKIIEKAFHGEQEKRNGD